MFSIALKTPFTTALNVLTIILPTVFPTVATTFFILFQTENKRTK